MVALAALEVEAAAADVLADFDAEVDAVTARTVVEVWAEARVLLDTFDVDDEDTDVVVIWVEVEMCVDLMMISMGNKMRHWEVSRNLHSGQLRCWWQLGRRGRMRYAYYWILSEGEFGKV